MKILALNPGSSSLKYGLFEVSKSEVEPKELVRGKIDLLKSKTFELALKSALSEIATSDGQVSLDAVACRVVHGGSVFNEPTLMSLETLEKLAELNELAPLHNPNSLELIKYLSAMHSKLPIYAVFDSAFHRTLPPRAYMYAVPPDLSDKIAIRRFGFHGISHRYIARRMKQVITENDGDLRLISCHLGNGSSICAILGGKSVDTSMGFTPLEGLVMGTRCGDIDPGAILYLLNHCGKTPHEIDTILNTKSGLLALGGDSDVRSLEQRAQSGDQASALALEVFAYRLAKYIAAYTVALQGVDVIAFSGGIGENSNMLRQQVCAKLAFMGIELEKQAPKPVAIRKISSSQSKAAVWIVPANEELQLVLETAPYFRAN